jgi:hypothetical protein
MEGSMTEKVKVTVTRSRSPHHRVVYANQTQLMATNVDIRLRFGVIERAEPTELEVEDQVDVVLGPQEMRGLYELLGRHLDKFPDASVEAPRSADQEDRKKS